MAGPVRRVSGAWAVALSLAAATAFFALATWAGEAPLLGRLGGAVWVFVLSMIVALPLLTGRSRRLERGGPG